MQNKIEWLSVKQLAERWELSDQGARKRAKRDGLEFRKKSVGRGFEFALLTETEAEAVETVEPTETESEAVETVEQYSSEQLWLNAANRTAVQRDAGQRRASLLVSVFDLHNNGMNLGDAFNAVGSEHSVSPANLKNWYYGNKNKIGAKFYAQCDWAAALISNNKTSRNKKSCNTEVWDFYLSHYLQRSQPSFESTYRRTKEVAQEQGLKIPSAVTLRRRLQKEVPHYTIVLRRQGPIVANNLNIKQKRDKTCFNAGQAVTGDGMKFDRLWIDWGDEIINTTTVWVWADIRTNMMLAHRIAKTENTDLFRLATYDLLDITLPEYLQIDNTRVAANKAMTSGVKHRYRFKKLEDEPIGMLPMLGIDAHFTNPDHEISNAGVKSIERSFGIGGLHSEVATSPLLKGQGYSKKTAISIDLLRKIVAIEVKRFNERPNRQTDVCNGTLSFQQAFNNLVAKTALKKATETQREIFLLMPEVAHCNRTNGQISLRASKGPSGKNRYWTEQLTEYMGQDVQVFFDPENLSKDLAVYDLKGQLLCHAPMIADTGFNDTTAAREHAKFTNRNRKSQKQISANIGRMTDLEQAALYEKTITEEAVEIPDSGVVKGHFKGVKNPLKDEIKTEEEESIVLDFEDRMNKMRGDWEKQA